MRPLSLNAFKKAVQVGSTLDITNHLDPSLSRRARVVSKSTTGIVVTDADRRGRRITWPKAAFTSPVPGVRGLDLLADRDRQAIGGEVLAGHPWLRLVLVDEVDAGDPR